MFKGLVAKFLITTVAILITAVVALRYVASFYETHEKTHTQKLTEWMVTDLIKSHAEGLIESAGTRGV